MDAHSRCLKKSFINSSSKIIYKTRSINIKPRKLPFANVPIYFDKLMRRLKESNVSQEGVPSKSIAPPVQKKPVKKLIPLKLGDSKCSKAASLIKHFKIRRPRVEGNFKLTGWEDTFT